MFLMRSLLRVALKGILRNRMRSLLTSLGIIIGVCAVIVMVAIGQGSQRRIEQQIAGLGTNVLTVFPGQFQGGGVSQGAGSANRLTLEDAMKLKQDATLVAAVSPVVRVRAQVIGAGKNWNTSINGVSPQYLAIRTWKMKDGEFFTDRDVLSNAKVAVIGQTVAAQLFPDQDPIGDQIQIRSTPFRIIGVLASKGQNPMGQDEDDVILAPYTTVLYRLKGGTYIDMINVSAVSSAQLPAAEEEIRKALRDAHRLNPADDDNFRIFNQADLTQAATSTSHTLTLLLGSIAGVSLVVGGIGIMNIMLVSVTERTREIGIRLSIGARASDILTQFLAEAVVLSAFGGVIGILLALGISVAIRHLTELSTAINPGIVLLAFSVSAGVGIFFGLYPARKAAALNPIDALRYE
jgi:putative ABC transport system permease protein